MFYDRIKNISKVCFRSYVPIILARYSEIGLKSTPVRLKFENRLRDNLISMLAYNSIEARVTKKDARFYIESSDIESTISVVRRVFGVASLSVAEECTSDMEDICATAAKYSLTRLKEGQSFAVKARREGIHEYTSVDIGREAGSAIFLANESKGIKVDLTDPDAIFYIEVRNNKAFIFESYVRCHAGLPIGTQGKAYAEVVNERDILSAWLMMKRGCKVLIKGERQPLLEKYDPDLKYVSEQPFEIMGIAKGTSFEEFEKTSFQITDAPFFFPTIGMTESETDSLLKIIKEE